MIDITELQKIGQLVRTIDKTCELVCRKINSLWEINESNRIIISINGILVPWKVLDWTIKGKDLLIFELNFIDTPTKAEKLINGNVYMLKKDIKHTQTNETAQNPIQHLINFKLIDEQQGYLGTIEKIDDSTINIVVETNQHHIVPLHTDFIQIINNELQEIHIILPFDVQSL